jgi:hypothetical protein
MRTIYIADDGTQFDDEFECEAYEWKLNHLNLKDVHAFNKDGIEFEDIFSEETYNYSTKIVVSSDEAAKELQELARYTGYCCYEDIDKAGEWIFDEKQETFVEVTK